MDRNKKKLKEMAKKKQKNWNPTGKSLFVVYLCPDCNMADASMIPPVMNIRLPFFVQCDCGSYKMYHHAWVCEPYKGHEILTGFMLGDPKIMHALEHELKKVTDQLDPDGTMMRGDIMMQDPEFLRMFEGHLKDQESKNAMFG